jgi:hypothetical protein
VLTCHFIRYSCCICSDNIPVFAQYLALLTKGNNYPFLKQDNQVVLLLSETSCSDSPGKSWMVMLQIENFSFMPLSGTFPANIYSLQKLVVTILISPMFDLLVYTSFHSSSI